MEEKTLINNASSAKAAYGDNSIEYVQALDRLAFYYRQNGETERAYKVLLQVKVCNCLKPVYTYILNTGAIITHAGQVWSKNCRTWIYFDSFIDCDKLGRELELAPSIEIHKLRDHWQGSEKGFICTLHHDGIMGKY